MLVSGMIAAGAAQELLGALAKRPVAQGISARAGLSRAVLQDESRMIPLASFTSILEAAAYESGNSTLGLELGKEFKLSALGPVTQLMRTAQTVGSGLEKFIRYFESVQTSTRSALLVSNSTARLTYAIADPAVRFRAQDAGFTMAIEYSMLAGLLGPTWKASGAEFEHTAGDDLAFYQQHFDCPLRFRCAKRTSICTPSLKQIWPMRCGNGRCRSIWSRASRLGSRRRFVDPPGRISG
jgi:hypothetical protein